MPHPTNTGKTHAPVSRVHGPDLKVSFDPPGSIFAIGVDARMPAITVICAPENTPAAAPAAQGAVTYTWNITLVMSPAGVPHAVGRSTQHPPIKKTTTEPRLLIPFVQVRGGTLTVSVSATIGGAALTGKGQAEIRGTNPGSGLIRSQGISELMLKLMTLESGLKQFLSTKVKTGYPVFSHDGLGGVGLGQLTHPRPTEDQIWNWKENARASAAQFQALRDGDAKRLLRKYSGGAAFVKLVQQYNAARIVPAAAKPGVPAAAPLKALTITLPEPTDEMLENETIRLYNGAPAVGEYIAETDKAGLLVVDVDKDGARGVARWHQVTGDERRDIYRAHGMKSETGDPDYVDHVRNAVVP